MKICIAGAGEVGMHLAKMLSQEMHDIVVIDLDQERLQDISLRFDVLTINGSATSIEILREATIKKCDLFISVTKSEEVNFLSAILAKKLGANYTIARIDNYEHQLPANKTHFLELGIDSLIYPQRLAAREITSLLAQTGTTEVFDFQGGKLSMFVIKLYENAPILNKTLREAAELDKRMSYRAVAITRNNKTIIPRGDDRFQINDLVYVITNQASVRNLIKYSGHQELDIHKIMILGGSRIGVRTAKELEKNISIKLVEMDKEKCLKITDFLSNTLVINGDGRNIDLLEQEGLNQMDAFIAATGNSETNIFSCLVAKQHGVRKTIAEVENIEYISIAEKMGIDAIINKKHIAASYIFRFTMNTEVNSIFCFMASKAEALEFVAKPKSKITQDKLRNIDFPRDAIIGGVVRGKSSFIAKGDSQIKVDDKVVVFALPNAIHKVGKYFR